MIEDCNGHAIQKYCNESVFGLVNKECSFPKRQPRKKWNEIIRINLKQRKSQQGPS